MTKPPQKKLPFMGTAGLGGPCSREQGRLGSTPNIARRPVSRPRTQGWQAPGKTVGLVVTGGHGPDLSRHLISGNKENEGLWQPR